MIQLAQVDEAVKAAELLGTGTTQVVLAICLVVAVVAIAKLIHLLVAKRTKEAGLTEVQATELAAIGPAFKDLRSKLNTDSGFAARFYRALCIFLANRLSRTAVMVGDNAPATRREEASEPDELSPDALDRTALAGARFDWFIKHVRSQ